MQKWADKEGVHCYRIYDRDLPEYNFSIDLYEKWVHLQEYAPPGSVDPDLASARLNHALQGIKELFGIRRDRIFVKTRRRQKGSEQYQQRESRKKLYEVREHGCQFLVNFTDYLDTGLFLDHRLVRISLAGKVNGKKFLNLFGYSGTATVHAGDGGRSLDYNRRPVSKLSPVDQDEPGLERILEVRPYHDQGRLSAMARRKS